jgi:hypothetical protein
LDGRVTVWAWQQEAAVCCVSVHDARMTKPCQEEACVLNPPH